MMDDKMRISLRLILLLLGFCLPEFVFAETVILKSGQQIEAKILEKTDKYIKVDLYGVPITYYFEDIESIDGRPISIYKDIFSTTSAKTPKDIFQEISPAVVCITTQSGIGEKHLGSGFIVDREGVIVTNYHVILSAQEVNVKLKDGKTYPATSVIYHNLFSDVCILKIDAQNLPVISLGNPNTLQIGETIYCIGNPLGYEYSFSDGLLSGIRDVQNLKWLQFTAPISPGNSGGPLLNSKGQAIGIVSGVGEGGQNLNFALSINEVKPYINTVPKMTFQDFVKKVSPADSYLIAGTKYFNQTDYHQAITNFERAWQINPNDRNTALLLGSTYLELKQYQNAITYLQRAIQINPNDDIAYMAYVLLADIYEELDQPQQYITYMGRFLQRFPNDHPTFYYNLGSRYYQLGQYKKAKESLQKAIEIFKSQGDSLGVQYAEEWLKKIPD